MTNHPFVKLTTSTGHTWTTNVSATTTEAQAKEYFLGQEFDISDNPDIETMDTVTEFEFIAPAPQL
ncbi:MAG: hypothetical protein LH702_04665 [Phormidesmis sp. CAN_BIN44]|nr:hypothetical protein [Phormidesmis sp. CAN_BIN44]